MNPILAALLASLTDAQVAEILAELNQTEPTE